MSVRIVIVGGVAGGMSAATRARRVNESAEITVLERGQHISFANCGLPYYLAGRIDRRDDLLVTNPDAARKRFNIDARTGHEVTRIDRAAKRVEVVDLATRTPYWLPYDKLILAPGASPIVPPIQHVGAPNVFFLRSMEDMDAADAYLRDKKPASVVIVGAGFIGLEMAEAMRQRGLPVTMVELAPHVLPPIDAELAPDIEAELRSHGVTVITGTGLQSLEANPSGQVTAVTLTDGRTIEAGMVFLSIGVRPNVSLAKAAGIDLGATGAIAVDSYQRTSDPDIYAVGDAAEVLHAVTKQPVRMPLAGPANRQGRVAGEHAATGSAPAVGPVVGTAIVKVFDIVAGVTGLSEPAARKAGFDVETAFVLPNHHASFYPGARRMRIKLVYDRRTGRALGAQLTGTDGVDKRLDVLATAIQFGATVDDLANLDLAYAPQFASAKDPIHMAAFVAQNQLRGLTEGIDYANLLHTQQLVDVRTPAEFARGTLPGARNIPLDDLRARLSELDPDSPTVVFCQLGQRGHVATRILRQRQFADVKNLKGGYALASAGRPTPSI